MKAIFEINSLEEMRASNAHLRILKISKGCKARVPNEPHRFYPKNGTEKGFAVHGHVCTCGLGDQYWVHKQKVGGSSPVTVIVLCL